MSDQIWVKITFKGNDNSLKVQKIFFCNGTTISPTGQGSPLDTDQDLQKIMANSGVKTEDLNTLVGYGLIDNNSLVELGLVDQTQINSNLISNAALNDAGITPEMLNNVNTTEIISALNEAGITPEMLNNTVPLQKIQKNM